jgi:hypothetical protein
MSFSKTLDIIGRRLIGRYDVTYVGVFPGLGIIMIFAGLVVLASMLVCVWRLICTGDLGKLRVAFLLACGR